MTTNEDNSQPAGNDYELASELENTQQVITGEESPEHNDDQQPVEQKPKKMGGYQRRIYNLQNENAELRKMLAGLQQGDKVQAPQQPVGTNKVQQSTNDDPEPKPEDYSDVFAYLKDQASWAARQESRQFREQFTSEQQKAVLEAEYEERQASFNEKVEADILSSVPDFWERAAELYQNGLVTPALENAILESDVGHMVSLYLMAHPQELQTLVGASEGQVYRAVALIESQLKNGLQSNAAGRQAVNNPQLTNRTTQANRPIRPVRAQAKTQMKSPDEMTMEEFRQWREGGNN